MERALEGDEGNVAPVAGNFARGSVEAACLATFVVPLVMTLSSHNDLSQLMAGWFGLVLGGGVFAAGPALWHAATSGIGRRLALLLSSLLATASVSVPLYLSQTRSDDPLVLIFGFGSGLALGLGQALAGVPFSMIPWRDGLSIQNPVPRAAMLVTYGSLLFLVPFSVIFFGMLGVPAERLANLGFLTVYAFPVLTLLSLALGPFAERLARKSFAKKPVASTHSQAVAAWREALGLAAQAVDPEARKRFLELALENARIAYAFSMTDATIPPGLSDDRRRYLELIFLLGKTDEIENALARFCESPVLEAELARLRGQPERAIELARQALDREETTATDRANAQSVLALAEAELGRFDEARVRLEAIARAQKMVKPLVPRFSASAVEVEIARLEKGGVERRRARVSARA
jgi:hypothetical protein